MSNEPSDKLAALTKKLSKKYAESSGISASELFPDSVLCDDPLMNELMVSMLLWESSVSHAQKSIEGIQSNLVDLNELRVCTPDELITIFGARMPKCSERVLRVLSVLNTVYNLENSLTLEHLREKNKRDVQAYLTGIDGLPQFVIARVLLIGLGLHAFPLDERIAKNLVSESVLSSGTTLDQQAGQMERLVRASDALATYTLVEHWTQESRTSPRTKKKTSTKSPKGATT